MLILRPIGQVRRKYIRLSLGPGLIRTRPTVILKLTTDADVYTGTDLVVVVLAAAAADVRLVGEDL